jgi:hypothetical protein
MKKKKKKTFSKTFSEIFQECSMNISQKVVTKVVQKQANVAHVIPFTAKHCSHNLVLRWNFHLPTFSQD